MLNPEFDDLLEPQAEEKKEHSDDEPGLEREDSANGTRGPMFRFRNTMNSLMAKNKVGRKVIKAFIGDAGNLLLTNFEIAAEKTQGAKDAQRMSELLIKFALKGKLLHENRVITQQDVIHLVDPVNSLVFDMNEHLRSQLANEPQGVDAEVLNRAIMRVKWMIIDLLKPHLKLKAVASLTWLFDFVGSVEFLNAMLLSDKIEEERRHIHNNLEELLAPLRRDMEDQDSAKLCRYNKCRRLKVQAPEECEVAPPRASYSYSNRGVRGQQDKGKTRPRAATKQSQDLVLDPLPPCPEVSDNTFGRKESVSSTSSNPRRDSTGSVSLTEFHLGQSRRNSTSPETKDELDGETKLAHPPLSENGHSHAADPSSAFNGGAGPVGPTVNQRSSSRRSSGSSSSSSSSGSSSSSSSSSGMSNSFTSGCSIISISSVSVGSTTGNGTHSQKDGSGRESTSGSSLGGSLREGSANSLSPIIAGLQPEGVIKQSSAPTILDLNSTPDKTRRDSVKEKASWMAKLRKSSSVGKLDKSPGLCTSPLTIKLSRKSSLTSSPPMGSAVPPCSSSSSSSSSTSPLSTSSTCPPTPPTCSLEGTPVRFRQLHLCPQHHMKTKMALVNRPTVEHFLVEDPGWSPFFAIMEQTCPHYIAFYRGTGNYQQARWGMRQVFAEELWKKYLQIDAPHPVRGLERRIMEKIRDEIKTGQTTPDTYTEARDVVQQLLQKSFRESVLPTPDYQAYLRSLELPEAYYGPLKKKYAARTPVKNSSENGS